MKYQQYFSRERRLEEKWKQKHHDIWLLLLELDRCVNIHICVVCAITLFVWHINISLWIRNVKLKYIVLFLQPKMKADYIYITYLYHNFFAFEAGPKYANTWETKDDFLLLSQWRPICQDVAKWNHGNCAVKVRSLQQGVSLALSSFYPWSSFCWKYLPPFWHFSCSRVN